VVRRNADFILNSPFEEPAPLRRGGWGDVEKDCFPRFAWSQ
jgi:hypothetical protein